jgi:hypothetical protein
MAERSDHHVKEVKTHVLTRDDFDYVALLTDIAFFLAAKAPGDQSRVVVLGLTFASHLAYDECGQACKGAEGLSATVFYDVIEVA